jgi:Ran-binding protein 9/10
MLSPPYSESRLIQLLISQYLVHDGFAESAQAFAQEVNEEYTALASANPNHPAATALELEEDFDANNRQSLFPALLNSN